MSDARSLEALEKAAEAGDATALHELYYAYATGGRGATRDTEKAMAFLHRAAEAGYALSQRFLANEIYGEDRRASLRWALAAAEQGDAPAMVHAGRMLLMGKAGAPDPEAALRWFEKAAALGDAEGKAAAASERRRASARGRSESSTIEQVLAGLGLGAEKKALLAVASPSVRLVTTKRAEKEISLGATKIGGSPDLPPRTEWPRAKETPLTFVAQLDLDALAKVAPKGALPAKGVLSFFYDCVAMPWGAPGEEAHWRVILSPRKGLERRKKPARTKSFPSCAVETFAELTIPPARSAQRRSLPEPLAERYGEVEEVLLRD